MKEQTVPPISFHDHIATPLLSDARRALKRGAWTEARHEFEAALASKELPETHEGLGEAAWWLEDVPTVFASRERAYYLYRARGDARSAARVATDLAFDYAVFRLELAISNGWIQRARRLLDDLPPGPEHIRLDIFAAVLCFHLEGDTARVLQLSRQARETAERLGLFELQMMSLAGEGLALVVMGQLTDGMRRLDEATLAAVSGEIEDLHAITAIICVMVWACEHARDIDRVTQWCDRFMTYCQQHDLRAYLAYCRCHYASALAAHGRWDEAELQLLQSKSGLRHWRAWSLTVLERLGELRRRQGRLDEAEAYFDQAAHDPQSLLGKARIAMDRGDIGMALELAETMLRRVPAQARSRRIALLEFLVRVHCARGAMEEALHALAELEAIGADFSTDWVTALVHHARCHVALLAGDVPRAKAHVEDALTLYDRSNLPYEVAQARRDLGRILAAMGRRDLAQEQAQIAADSLRNLGVNVDAAHDVGPGAPATDFETRLSPRERDVLTLLARGFSNQQIADELYLSRHTVRRHVSNILTKFDVPSRTAAVAYAIEHNLT